MQVTLKDKFIGDKAFYSMVLAVAVPIMVQNGITNFVNLLDNLMVGQLGTEPMSGVAIVNQLIMVYNICIFGAVSGSGLFTAQYYGKGDMEGVRNTFRFKLISVAALTVAGISVFLIFGKDLISLYLSGSSDGGDLAMTLKYAWQYLLCLIPGLIPFMIEQGYASTLRECGETILPMKAGIAAVIVNVVFNYLLIFGKFGFPELGVMGAGIATSLARFVEAGIIIIWAHTHVKQVPFVASLYRTFKVPVHLVKEILKKGTPLLMNEAMWSGGMAFLTQCYSLRGLNVIAGFNITSTLFNMANVAILAIGTAIAIIIGQLLGANKIEEAVDKDNKLIAFAMMLSVGIGLIVALIAPFFPELYDTTEAAKEVATRLMLLQACFFPSFAFMNSAYFTMRSGGKTFITFLFDSVFVWVVSVPIAFVCSRYTGMNVYMIFLLVNLADLIKIVIGSIMLKKRMWVQNIVDEK